MTNDGADVTRVVIVGGGISGLATALAVRDRAGREGREVELVVLEKSARAGGPLRTDVVDGYVCEWGPNGFLDNVPETLDLVRRVGLEGRLQPSNDTAKRRYLYRRGALRPIPGGIGALLGSSLLSWPGKLRLLAEPFVAPRRGAADDRQASPVQPALPALPALPAHDDESIRDFAVRRIGAEAADVLVDAIVSGIFAGDPSRLSLRACFPKVARMEAEHGGLVRAMLASRKGKRRGEGIESLRPVPGPGDGRGDAGATVLPAGRLTSLRGGLEELVGAIARTLGGSLRTETPAASLAPRTDGPRWSVVTEAGEAIAADAVVLAGPAGASAGLVSGLDASLGTLLREIPFAPLAVVCLGYDAASLPRALDGFGFLVPRGEGPRILGVLWDSSIFPGRAPRGKALLRVMIGGAHMPEAAELPDGPLLALVKEDLVRTMGPLSEPELVRIHRHAGGIPQYTIGHLGRLARIDAALARHPGLFLTGSSYRGVAINACIAAAGPLADRVLSFVEAGRSGPLRSTMNV